MKITNNTGVSLPLAVWLLHDTYDYVDMPNYISATSLMKPLRQLILPNRVPAGSRTADVVDYVARTLGHSIHDSIERAWLNGKDRSLKLLGYPESVIERVVVNPTPEELRARNDIIPVYVEQRAFKEVEVDGVIYTIGGKYDMIADGAVNDFKSTSCFTWTKGGKEDDYRLQGSIYRWLNPDKVTEDYIRINFVFTDWSKMMLNTAGYPDSRVKHKDIPLLSAKETEQWIKDKIRLYARYKDKPEDQIPECSDAELWRSDPQFKYYSDPTKANQPGSRATKNFDNLVDARKFQVEKGGKGVIVTKLGEPKACGYCPGFDACTQKDRLGLNQEPTILSNDLLDAVLI